MHAGDLIMDVGTMHLPTLQVVILGAAVLVLLYLSRGIVTDLRGGDPRTRMRRRLDMVVGGDQPAKERVSEEVHDILNHRHRSSRDAKTWVGRKLMAVHERIAVIGGRPGLGAFYALPIVAIIASILAQKLGRPWDGVYVLPVSLAIGIGAAILTFRFLERRFQLTFLNDFPDVLDLIVRAVRAGVPVAQAIHVAGQELNEPVRTEFKNMADSLRLGADMGDVLKEAASRIRVPDFNFFAVCILLQRETGGQLAETLENLARIIRARRDVRLKAKALVAEGRASSKAIGAIPFISLGFLYLLSEDYVDVLFKTEIGHKLLFVAGTMLVIGFIIINRISRLED